jgi:hypothetical protein
MPSPSNNLAAARDCVSLAHAALFDARALLAQVRRSESAVDVVLATSRRSIQASRELLRKLDAKRP